ncbi:unnamed protein product [Lathyrus oleraceus]
MVDRHDRLRHDRVSQHAFVRREKSQHVFDAPGPSGQEYPSTYEARASPHAITSSSSYRDEIHHLKHQVSLVSPPTTDPLPPHTVDPLPPSTTTHIDLVPPPKGETVVDVKPEAFGGGLVDLSLLSLYPGHTVIHIWDEEEHDPQKFVNHGRKIVMLPQPNED